MSTHTISIRTISIRRTTAMSALIGLALTVGAPMSSAVLAGPVEDVAQRCMSDAPGTPDSRERWTDVCQQAADEYAAAYHDCMHDAPGSADSRERWVDHCAATASTAVATD